ncbi:uncharacterized protein ATNIH1004_000188 [Aspergillus tanneri]|uniref:Uncharacterized protein n=1 Tax=Aspergillus tanneri TaxID=1220188 RepID=A0A5M9N9R5_9EURO|nr:uncharacterized protein ATNIH1004_000188 [Aspergillus tanneri]KAA8651307.1 hypothetical protein ATNIH1004_000188 [Aspergillus tanneri]
MDRKANQHPAVERSRLDYPDTESHKDIRILTVGTKRLGSTECDNEGMGIDASSDEAKPRGVNDNLYQTGFSGFFDFRDVQLHKVLVSWAERVERGD